MACIDCCNQIIELLNQIGSKVDGLLSRLRNTELKLAKVESVVTPVIPYQNELDPIIAYFLDKLRTSKTYRLILLDRVVTSLRETGKDNRFITVSILSDALGKWLLDCFLAFLAALPKELRIDPPTNGSGEPEYITVLTFGQLGKELEIKEALLASQVNLDGGTSERTGGTEAYGASVGSTGLGLGQILGAYTFGLAEGVAKGLKAMMAKGFKIELPDPDEIDPHWGRDKNSSFAFGQFPSEITPEQLAEVTATSRAQVAKNDMLVTKTRTGTIQMTPIPFGFTPFLTKKEGDVTSFTNITDPTATPIQRQVLPDGSILYTNINPLDDPFVTFTDADGVYHATNLQPGSDPFYVDVLPDGSSLYSNVPYTDIPFTTSIDENGTIIITQK